MRVARVAAGAGLTIFSIAMSVVTACSDDDDSRPGVSSGSSSGSSGVVDGGPGTDGFVQPPPTYDGGTPPTDGVDRTGKLGPITLVADLGQSVDGPSWRNADESLYFTVPSATAPLLKRIKPGAAGAVAENVNAWDGGPPGVLGTASNGGDVLFFTEVNSISTLVLGPDAGPNGNQQRTGSFEHLGDIAAVTRTNQSTLSFFVDNAGPRAYRYDPLAAAPNDLIGLIELDAGAGLRATAIAVGNDEFSQRKIYVAVGGDGSSNLYVIRDGNESFPGVQKPQIEKIIPLGIPANGVAIDKQQFIYVAWARGIDVFDRTGQRLGASPGLPIAAIPTSLAFGGADGKTLYITTATGKIYGTPSAVSGVLR